MADILLKSGEESLKALKPVINDLNTLFASFSESPSQVESTYLKSFDTTSSPNNTKLGELKAKVQDQASQTLDLVRSLALFVQLLVPKVEDGNNFGVGIQMQFIKRINEFGDKVSEIFDKIASFQEKRAGLVAKTGLIESKSKEVKNSVIVEAIEADKKGKTVTENETVTSKSPNEHELRALASLDVNMFLQLKESVRVQRDILAIVDNFMEKNGKKIKEPRGTVASYY